MTNYEKIKAMSIDEMIAAMEGECCFCLLKEGQNCDNTDCKTGAKQWLEAEEEMGCGE